MSEVREMPNVPDKQDVWEMPDVQDVWEMPMRILGTGSARPQGVLTNDMLSQMVDTSDEWIRTRTGIRSRYIADPVSPHETTVALAREAAGRALKASAARGVLPSNIGVVICATVTNEIRCPSVACYLQRDLGLPANVLAFDLNAACSGYIYALIVASRFVREDSYALVVGSEVLSRFVDFSERETCILFGDGAGAAVVGPAAAAGLDKEAADKIADLTALQPFAWGAEASGDDAILKIDDFIHMDGPAVFKFAVEILIKNILAVTARAGVSVGEVAHFICHQANERILALAAKRLGVPLERFFMNLSRYGNTSAASIPLALDEAVRAGLLKPGAPVVLAGFGGGLTAGAICFIWD